MYFPLQRLHPAPRRFRLHYAGGSITKLSAVHSRANGSSRSHAGTYTHADANSPSGTDFGTHTTACAVPRTFFHLLHPFH